MTNLTPHRWFRVTRTPPANPVHVDAEDTEGSFVDLASVERPNSWLLAASPEQLAAAGATECSVIGAPGHPLLYENYPAPDENNDLIVIYSKEARPLETARTRVLDYVAGVKTARQGLEAAEAAKVGELDEISGGVATADFEDFEAAIAAAEALDPAIIQED